MVEKAAGVRIPALPGVAWGGSQTGLAMIVPLRYLLGTTTDPVGVPDSRGVAASELSVDISVSLFGAEFEGCDTESERRSIWLVDVSAGEKSMDSS
jgi:hypothetical protein